MSDPPPWVPNAQHPDKPKASLPAWLWAALGGAVVVIIGLIVVVIVLATGDGGDVTGGGSKASSTPKAGSSTMIVSGTFTLTSANVSSASGAGCFGTEGFDDITPGAQIVIRNKSGETVGVGALGLGALSDSVVCQFTFSVANVPRGLGIYSVEISHRGEISFEESQAQALVLTLS